MIRRLIARTLGKIYDSYALQLIDRGDVAFTAWTSSAVRPGAVACIVNDIVINGRSVIVEFGSGISTLIIARQLQEGQHTYLSFEHDESWAAKVRLMLREAGLSDRCEVVHAPLKSSSYSIDGSRWYDDNVIRDRLDGLEIDLVLCDGPLADRSGLTLSRYPAIPVIQSFLGEQYAIYLDDIDRPGEREIARRWGRLLDTPFQNQLMRGSFALATKGKSFNSLI